LVSGIRRWQAADLMQLWNWNIVVASGIAAQARGGKKSLTL
jgi:hypothetical protein